jgi:hypothetical protein
MSYFNNGAQKRVSSKNAKLKKVLNKKLAATNGVAIGKNKTNKR